MSTDVVIQRIIAFIIDLILVAILSLAIGGLLSVVGFDVFDVDEIDNDAGFSRSYTLSPFIWAATMLVYKAWQEVQYGKTLGKRALNLRVVRSGTGDAIEWRESIIRNLFLIAPLTLIGLGNLAGFAGLLWLIASAIYLFRSPERQRFGDKIADTHVVRHEASVPVKAAQVFCPECGAAQTPARYCSSCGYQMML